MNSVLLVYILITLVLIRPLVIQFKIIKYSPEDDELIITKVLFFVFNLCLIAVTWLCYFKLRQVAWFYLLILAIICYYTYKPKKRKHMNNQNMFLDWVREAWNRLSQKSPKFFKVWQILWGGLLFLSGIPYTLAQFNITLPPPIDFLSSKFVAAMSFGAWLMSQFAIKTTPVAQTTEGSAVTILDKDKLPYTSKTESKEVQEQVPQPPVVSNLDDPNENIAGGVPPKV